MFLAVCRKRAWSFSFRECSAWEMRDADRSMHCLQFAICWASLRSLITLNRSMESVTCVSSCSESASGCTLFMQGFCCMKVSLQYKFKKWAQGSMAIWHGTLLLDIFYLLGEVLLVCFMNKHWIANCFPVDGGERCCSVVSYRGSPGLFPWLLHTITVRSQRMVELCLSFQLCHQENKTSL